MEPQAQVFVGDMIAFARSGLESVNGVLGLALALIGAYYLSHWPRVFAVALGAVAAHVLINTVFSIGWVSGLTPPPFADPAYGEYLIQLYLGYLIVISAFYLVKSLIKGSAG